MPQRPNVIPSGNPAATVITKPFSLDVNHDVQTDTEYESKKLIEAEAIYDNSLNETGMDAVQLMRNRTAEQIKLRDQQLLKNLRDAENYGKQVDEAKSRETTKVEPQKVPLKSIVKSPVSTLKTPEITMSPQNTYIQQISQPQYDAPFDMIPIPSEGRLYPNVKSNIKVAYMTAADENILTSPNLLESGEFLEILINRKLLEPTIRYKDLHIGDRNAIMLWLRATSYGELYPVTLLDEEDVPFDTKINLNDLKFKKLNDLPDEEGLFDYMMPLSKAGIKFKLLTVGDLEEIENLLEEDKKAGYPVNNANTYTLERQIIEVNGIRDPEYVKNYVNYLRTQDAKNFKEHVANIESGVELDINVGTPGGGSVKTFLPLNVGFFWPNLTL